MYSCQEAKPSGTEAILISAMEMYEMAATTMELKRILLILPLGKEKCAVSNDVTSKPTNAHGARMTIPKIAYASLSWLIPKEETAPLENALGRQNTPVITTPASMMIASTVSIFWSIAFAKTKSTPISASTRIEITASIR